LEGFTLNFIYAEALRAAETLRTQRKREKLFFSAFDLAEEGIDLVSDFFRDPVDDELSIEVVVFVHEKTRSESFESLFDLFPVKI
jgi:hypothetical protein